MITLVDQIVRFHHLVTVPQNDLVESGQVSQAWRNARPTFLARILGPQFEQCARDWVRRCGMAEANLPGGTVAPTVVSAGPGRPAYEVDVVTVAGREVRLVGEAKASIAVLGRTELQRLDRIASILTDQQRDATRAVRALVSMQGVPGRPRPGGPRAR